MTGMLASVNSVEEAILVLNAKVDIIDLKQPELGALGALETDLVKRIVDEINGQCLVSATIGDLPMQPKLVYDAVTAMASTYVDYIKIGFFPGGNWQGTLEKLASFTFPRRGAGTIKSKESINLIAVLFADTQPDFAIIAALKNAGFKGVMLDTMDKKRGSLTQVITKTDLAQFVRLTKTHAVLCGLAGSLRLEDIPELMTYQPDYLGFRGALCLGHNRTAKINKQSVLRIKLALDQ